MRYEVRTWQWGPGGRRQNVSIERFSTMERASAHADRFKATPPCRQQFAIEIRDRSRGTDARETVWANELVTGGS